MRKNEKVGKTFRLHNGAIRRLHIGAGFRAYRSEQERIQIGTALVFSNRDKQITNRAGISNRSKDISNQGRDYK